MLELLAALGLGGLLGGWLRGAHERQEAHRERMVKAAELLLDRTEEARKALRRADAAVKVFLDHEEEDAAQTQALGELAAASEAARAVDATVPRIGLTFPNVGDPTVHEAAGKLSRAVRNYSRALAQCFDSRRYDEGAINAAQTDIVYWVGFITGRANRQIWRARLRPRPGETRVRLAFASVRRRILLRRNGEQEGTELEHR